VVVRGADPSKTTRQATVRPYATNQLTPAPRQPHGIPNGRAALHRATSEPELMKKGPYGGSHQRSKGQASGRQKKVAAGIHISRELIRCGTAYKFRH